MLVTGEPGAGKTGVLLSLTDKLDEVGIPNVFLSAERLASFTSADDFRRQLQLNHGFLDVLAAWPGATRGVIVIDALDASRGGTGEEIIASFVEDVSRELEDRWSIVASIRSFDLRNGRRFRLLAKGSAPDQAYAEKGLEGIRHFRIPRLSRTEIEATRHHAPQLLNLYEGAPDRFQALLANIFNLSIAAELLASGVSPESIRAVSTQSELLRTYEDNRITTQATRRAARVVVEAMIAQRTLTVRNVDVPSNELDALLHAGVLTDAGDLISFAHHVLFDHIAGRFYLDWNNPGALVEQLSAAPLAGLLLGPALRFALELMWAADTQTRDKIWKLLAELARLESRDPVLVSIAVRTVVDNVEQPDDISALRALVSADPSSTVVERLILQTSRFVELRHKAAPMANASIVAWSELAEAIVRSPTRALASSAGVLLWSFIETGNLHRPEPLFSCGRASRALLYFARSLNPEFPYLNTTAIRMVTRTFGSDPAASQAALQPILTDERLEKYAPEEMSWLAEGIKSIIDAAPAFAIEVYDVAFRFEPSEDAKTWLGGGPSRILALSSSARQDYEHARWQLKESLPHFLKSAPQDAVLAIVRSVLRLSHSKRRARRDANQRVEVTIGDRALVVIDDQYGWQDWRESGARAGDSPDELLNHFVNFLRETPEESFLRTITTVSESETNASVWARLLGVAAERRFRTVDDRLWVLAAEPKFTMISGLARDAIMFLGAVYAERTTQEKMAFEQTAIDVLTSMAEPDWWQSLLARLLSILPEDQIATAAMRSLRAKLAAEDELRGNEPFITVTSGGWLPNEHDIVDTLLRRDGVDLDDEAVKTVREASRTLDALVRAPTDKTPDAPLLWRHAIALQELLDTPRASPLPEAVLHSSWGSVSNAVERITQADAYLPGTNGLPSLDELVALIERLSKSPYPGPRQRDDEDESMAWGNWDVRVYAAIAASQLAPRFGKERSEIIDIMEALLDDPEATVRLQIAERLNGLWNANRERMWLLFEKVARSENNIGVLSFFIAGPMQSISGADRDRTLHLVNMMLVRLPRPAKDHGRDEFREAIGSLVGGLYVVHNEPTAWQLLSTWVKNLIEDHAYLRPVLYALRTVFFFRYKVDSQPGEHRMQERAMAVLRAVVEHSRNCILEATAHLKQLSADDPDVDRWRNMYRAADNLIDQAGSQLYFGSGAFQSSQRTGESLGLNTSADKQAFLRDYDAIIDAIADAASPRTLHYLLQMLGYLADGAPDAVFAKISRILLGRAADEGYHFESLAVDELVSLVERYLADHRVLFEANERRQQLIKIVELFATVGWPKALKLLYDLPDLLR
ncbi:hypothetical protein C6P82_17190 [Burkholderia multivorans]|nr:hypothetical protein C6P82_17190 [Burkholderia multivorans]